MNEGLEAFENILNQELIKPNKYRKTIKDIASVGQVIEVEKELEQAQEDKKVLDIFKNSLTIEHCPISIEPLKDGEDFVGSLFRNITTIRTNELDKNLRETLRDWVLKNAFPKEIKALNEILSLYDKWLGNEMSDFEFFTLLSEVKDEYGLSKEVGL